MSIFSEYNEFRYIYPPRAEHALKYELLNDLSDGWVAQPKYNGSCAVLFINGDTDYTLYNRYGQILTSQRPLNYLALNDSNKYMVLCGEYLNKNKTGEDGQEFNHKFIIWDILVWKGKYLVGWTVEARLDLLHQLYGRTRSCVTGDTLTLYDHLFLTSVDNVFLAPSYINNFGKLYKEVVQTDLYEGLVLKRANAELEVAFGEKNNASWQLKIRKATKNYKF